MRKTRYNLAATTVGNYALFGGGSSNGSAEVALSTIDYYKYNANDKPLYVYKGAKYKFIWVLKRHIIQLLEQ